MSVQSFGACISQGYENLVVLFDAVDAFLAVDQREEAYAAEVEPGDNLPSLFTGSWANPIYPRWFMDAVKFWERHRDIIDLNYAHQTKSSSDSLGDESSSIDTESISQDGEGLQERANNVIKVQRVGDATITCNAEETTTPGRNVTNEADEIGIACIHNYDLAEENEAGPSINDYDLSEDYSSDNNRDGPSRVDYDPAKEDGVGSSIYDYDLSEEDLSEEDEAEASKQQYILHEENETERMIQSVDQKDEQVSDFSNPAASSCEACMLPDNDSMLMCENEAIHKDSESWYHFSCVGLSVETIPTDTWYCPPCHSKMREKTESSPLSHGNDRGVIEPQKKKCSAEIVSNRPGESGRKRMKAQPKPRKPKGTAQGGQKQSKQPISKNADAGKSKIPKVRWKDPIEQQKVAELVREYQNDPTVPERDKYREAKWKAIAKLLLERHGYSRTAISIKLKFSRTIRKSANYDERSEKKKNPNSMQTSVESPESRKRKRQAKAQASGEPLSMWKRAKRQSREEEEAQEDINRVTIDQGPDSSNAKQGDISSNDGEEDLNGDGSNENDGTDSRNFESRVPPQFRQFDWSPQKNKGKRKRDENDEDEGEERHAQMPRSS